MAGKLREIPDLTEEEKERNNKLLLGLNSPSLVGFTLHIQRYNSYLYQEKWLEEKIEELIREREGRNKKFVVKKNGVEEEVEIDENRANFLKFITNKIYNKDTVRDIFKYSVPRVDPKKGCTEVAIEIDEKRYVMIKAQRILTNATILNHRMATALKAIRGMAYVRSSLKRIQLVIQQMIFDVEEGLEVQIPRDLS